MEIVNSEEKKGHHSAAQMLRGSLHPNGWKAAARDASPLPPHVSGLILEDALSQQSGQARLRDVMLGAKSRNELESVVKEWTNRDRLREKGIRRRSKLFFYGPTGCGKSLTAQALGQELSLPTYVVRFDAIIGAYLGQTALHLRELFRFAEATPCVLLFDEVDALGKKRGNPLDVGELDRIVISLMQELEHSEAKGIIIATSNLPKHLDEALWRRFDLLLEFPRPSKQQLRAFAKSIAEIRRIVLPHRVGRKVLCAKSYAEAEKLVEEEARRVALETV